MRILDEELAHEDMMLGHRGGRRVAPDDLADANGGGQAWEGKGVGVDRSRHFNYYAFDGATGSTRWRHESEDFHRDLDGLADRLTPQHNYRLTAQASNGHHYGEAACRDFRESVVVSALRTKWRGARTQRSTRAFLPGRPKGEVSKGGIRAPAGGGRGGGAGVPAHNPVARTRRGDQQGVAGHPAPSGRSAGGGH